MNNNTDHFKMNYLRKIYWTLRNKVTNKLFHRVRLPAMGKNKGEILFAYITEPFTVLPWRSFSNIHTMYWECFEIARLFSEKGYAVDIIDSKKTKNIQKKNYLVFIDTENNIEKFEKSLPINCKKVFHILISHWSAYNKSEQDRLDYLEKRKGVKLKARRKVAPSQSAELADYLEGFGNKAIFQTFEQFGKKPYFIPISAVLLFDFPKNKHFEDARKHFIWFGGGGAVLKGLDLAIEAFTKIPDLHLHICGPIFGEEDFVNLYKKELTKTPNIHVYGRIDVASEQFKELINKCGAVIYPSNAEGSSGAIVQAMHAGLVPIITHETGIQETANYIPLVNPSPESVAETAISFSKLPPEEIRKKSLAMWKYARDNYTREKFSETYSKFIDDILKL
jgi:glycosyltransferase involved in cell wall biosynthesis